MNDDKQNKKTSCIGIFGRIFGHKFRAVFDAINEAPVNLPNMNDFYSSDCSESERVEDIILACKPSKTIYRGHVCNRCGEVVNRSERLLQ